MDMPNSLCVSNFFQANVHTHAHTDNNSALLLPPHSFESQPNKLKCECDCIVAILLFMSSKMLLAILSIGVIFSVEISSFSSQLHA